jgi:hypothetical protein
MGTLTKLHRWIEYEASTEDATRAAGGDYAGVEDATATAPATLWSIVSWGDWVFATNYIDEIQIFQGSIAAGTNFVDLDTLADITASHRADILGKIGPFLFMFRVKDNAGAVQDFTIEWCDNDDPLTWTPATANAAGTLEARDLGSPIIAAVPFADGYAVYGVNECRYLSFVGAPDYFGLRPLLSGVGALGKASVIPVERLQYGMGPRGIWVHDGSQSKYIDTPDIHDYIYGDINRDQVSKSVVAYDAIENMVLFFWPSEDSMYLDRGAGFNRNNRSWTKLSYARTAYSSGQAFEAALTGSRAGDVWLHSSPGFAPVGEGTPLILTPSVTNFQIGYGQGGYGQGYYGGNGHDVMDG